MKRYYESRARRAYWSLHIEAWLRSGVTRYEYCNDNRLCWRSMRNWMRALETPLPRKRKAIKKPAPVTLARMPKPHTIAFKAFWLMHAEAQHGSGLTPTQYANAHRLPVRRMRRESRAFTRAVPAQDWRDMLHPKGLHPRPARSDLRQESRQAGPEMTTARAADESGQNPVRERRRYTDAQKLAIVAEAADSGITDSEVARRHGVTPAMISRWRKKAGLDLQESTFLVAARVMETPARGRPKQRLPLVLHDLLPTPPGMIAVDLADGRRVFAPTGSDVQTVRQYIADKESNHADHTRGS